MWLEGAHVSIYLLEFKDVSICMCKHKPSMLKGSSPDISGFRVKNVKKFRVSTKIAYITS